jgi:membrane associated rhomboid family serine protease
MSDESNAESGQAEIIAYSEQQALDWQLVLVSQDINSTVVKAQTGGVWRLLIPLDCQERARAAIDQYLIENPPWKWRRPLPVPLPGVLFHWGVVVWTLAMILFHALQSIFEVDLSPQGHMHNAGFMAGQWWRPFTAVMLHADGGHLASNMATGTALMGLAMARYGPGWGLLGAYLAGVMGNLMGLALYASSHRSLGASGMVMGALGLVCIQSIALRRDHPLASRILFSGVASGVLLFMLLGLNPDSDVIAHLGGFFGGLVAGGLMASFPTWFPDTSRGNAFAVFVLVSTIVSAWMAS